MGLQVADYALDGRTHFVDVEGQVDLYSAPALKERALHVVAEGREHVIVDLSRVSFIDSTGLGILVMTLKSLRRRGGALSLVVTDYDLERLFEKTGLDGTFAIFRSRDDALEHLEKATRS